MFFKVLFSMHTFYEIWQGGRAAKEDRRSQVIENMHGNYEFKI